MILYLIVQAINYLIMSYIGFNIQNNPEKVKPIFILFIGWFVFMNPITMAIVSLS